MMVAYPRPDFFLKKETFLLYHFKWGTNQIHILATIGAQLEENPTIEGEYEELFGFVYNTF